MIAKYGSGDLSQASTWYRHMSMRTTGNKAIPPPSCGGNATVAGEVLPVASAVSEATMQAAPQVELL